MQEHEAAASDDEKLPERHGRAPATKIQRGVLGVSATEPLNVSCLCCVLNHVAPQRKLQQE
jgi:hypothetical protein